LRVEPGPRDTGVEFHMDVDVRLVPLYIYKTTELFHDLMAQYVRDALEEGLHGWRVTDCIVTMTDCGYGAPGTTAGDFRKLTPLVLMRALEEAGTVVCEPMTLATIELPTESVSAVLPLLGRLGARIHPPITNGDLSTLEAVLPVGRLTDLRQRLPAATAGEGVLETRFAGYEPVAGTPPIRSRTRPNPLDREQYLLHLARWS
jgi:ribosomal protection tetracycline resistance protein